MNEWIQRNRTSPLGIMVMIVLVGLACVFLYTWWATPADAQIAAAATTWLTELEASGPFFAGFGLFAMAVGFMAGIAGVVYTGIATVAGGAIISNLTALTGFFGGA